MTGQYFVRYRDLSMKDGETAAGRAAVRAAGRSAGRSAVRSAGRSAGRAAVLACVLAITSGAIHPCAVPVVRAQEVLAPDLIGPEFHASMVTFRSEEGVGQTLVEVYVSVAHDQLAFTRAGSIFRAEYDLSLVLVGPRGETVFDETTTEQTTTPAFEETVAEDIVRVKRFTFVVRPGTYELQLRLSDRNNEDPRELDLEITVPRYSDTRLGISDILLADYLGESAPDLPPGAVVDYAGSRLFARRGHAYIPNTRGIYANFAPSVLAYYEVYGFNPLRRTELDRAYQVEFWVNNDDDETEIYYLRRHDKPGDSAYNSVEMNIQDLTPGTYELQIDITDLGSGTTVTSRREFTVLESYLTTAYREYDKAVNQLRYIASTRELRLLREAPEGQRLSLFRRFWASRDPTPGTKRNESMVEYYRRIAYANETFGVAQLEGWATDRGMVYITLGLPDYIERQQFARGSKPAQLWVYNSVRLNLLFVDESGFGDFVLQNRDEYMQRVQWRPPRQERGQGG